MHPSQYSNQIALLTLTHSTDNLDFYQHFHDTFVASNNPDSSQTGVLYSAQAAPVHPNQAPESAPYIAGLGGLPIGYYLQPPGVGLSESSDTAAIPIMSPPTIDDFYCHYDFSRRRPTRNPSRVLPYVIPDNIVQRSGTSSSFSRNGAHQLPSIPITQIIDLAKRRIIKLYLTNDATVVGDGVAILVSRAISESIAALTLGDCKFISSNTGFYSFVHFLS